ncbi:MAG: dienelactone hydrolase family protein [Acidimicrobiia bacterium]|nr:dienelactone hydrolase family protein [Acidimicrobiia bacterium]
MSAQIQDIAIAGAHQAYLVRPEAPVDGAAVMFLHWFDEAPNANRSQFLDEAKALADAGVVSLLPQLQFPWHSHPTDAGADISRIKREHDALMVGIETLRAQDGIDPDRIAVVGHDFGAMHGTLVLREIHAACAVMVAPTARWADWFLRFWPIETDRFDYMRSLDPLDPITALPDAGCPVLFQFARSDFYIAAMTGTEMLNAARDPKEMLAYDGGHALDLDPVRQDRDAFLRRHLGLLGEPAAQ